MQTHPLQQTLSSRTYRSFALNYRPFNLMTPSLSQLIVLRATLFFFVLSAVFLLFFAAFSIPYINTVYFVKITLNSASEVLTLGTFGICLEYDGVKECSPGVTGYQIDDLLFTGPVQLPEISSTITKGLTLHVVAFVLSLVAATIILCSNFRNSSLGRWIIETIVLLALFVIASFAIDLALFFSVRKIFANTEASVQIGNGTWLTLASLVFLLWGTGIGVVLPKPVSSASEDIENASDDSWGNGHSEVLHIRPSFDEDYKEEGNPDKHLTKVPYDRSLKGAQTPNESGSPNPPTKPLAIHKHAASLHRQPFQEALLWAGTSANIAEEHPSLSPLRRVPSILINGTHRDSTQSSVLLPTIPVSSSSPTPSGYAPSTYSTCPSDGSSTGMTTPQTLSRSSTLLSVFARQAARRSTQDWQNFERRNGKGTSSRQFMNSVSTFGSVLQHFPTVPSPHSVAPVSFALLQLRDRFREVDPAFNAEVGSIVSAVPSSDLELDVQTAPSSSPKITLSRELPKIPSIPPHSDQITLA